MNKKIGTPKGIQNSHNSNLLIIFVFIRLMVSTAFRMVYPFLPALARGLSVSFESIAMAVSARSALGIFSPALGAIADLHGRKQALIAALLIFGLSLLVIALYPIYKVFFLGLLISGGATVIIDSSIHAYLGDKIPYSQRGRAIAIVELGWSLAYIIGIPIVGWNMTNIGWSSPFLWLGIIGVITGGIIYIILPSLPAVSNSIKELKFGLYEIIHPSSLSGLALAFFTVLANQIINIVFGVWLEGYFNLKLNQIGAYSSIIGIAGVCGVICAILLTDRLGKPEAIGVGLGLNSLICLVLPLIGKKLLGVMILLFLLYLSFEFILTSLIPLLTTFTTHGRGTFMAISLAVFSLGDSVGALIGPKLIQKGIFINFYLAILFNAVAILLLISIKFWLNNKHIESNIKPIHMD